MGYLNPINKAVCLEQVYASNYQKIFQLVPELLNSLDSAQGISVNNSALYLEVIERSPYTITIVLSHCFSKSLKELLEPAVKIRIYLDAKLAEVLSDHARTAVSRVYKNSSPVCEIMNYKWRLNYFLQKWLDHCLNKDYQFTTVFLKTESLA